MMKMQWNKTISAAAVAAAAVIFLSLPSCSEKINRPDNGEVEVPGEPDQPIVPDKPDKPVLPEVPEIQVKDNQFAVDFFTDHSGKAAFGADFAALDKVKAQIRKSSAVDVPVTMLEGVSFVPGSQNLMVRLAMDLGRQPFFAQSARTSLEGLTGTGILPKYPVIDYDGTFAGGVLPISGVMQQFPLKIGVTGLTFYTANIAGTDDMRLIVKDKLQRLAVDAMLVGTVKSDNVQELSDYINDLGGLRLKWFGGFSDYCIFIILPGSYAFRDFEVIPIEKPLECCRITIERFK